MRAERCVCCGAVIPEGLQVCGMCSAGRQEDRMSVINGVWHDVEMDPPQREGSYLAATDRGGVVIAHWYPNKNLDGTAAGGGRFSGYHGHITHWMDRPEPPGGWREKKEKVFRGAAEAAYPEAEPGDLGTVPERADDAEGHRPEVRDHGEHGALHPEGCRTDEAARADLKTGKAKARSGAQDKRTGGNQNDDAGKQDGRPGIDPGGL